MIVLQNILSATIYRAKYITQKLNWYYDYIDGLAQCQKPVNILKYVEIDNVV